MTVAVCSYLLLLRRESRRRDLSGFFFLFCFVHVFVLVGECVGRREVRVGVMACGSTMIIMM